MAEETNQPDPTQSSKASGPGSEEEGTSLEGLRGANPAIVDSDDANNSPTLEQMIGTEPPAEEGETPTEDGNQKVAKEVDGDIADLQGRLLASDKDRTRRAQETALIKNRLAELGPSIDLGIQVQNNPQLLALVERVLKGEPITQAQEKAGNKAAKDAGMTPETFLQTVTNQVSQQVTANVQDMLQRDAAASRQFKNIEAQAQKELPHFDAVQKHPGFLGYVQAVNHAIDSGSELVPEGVDKSYHALHKAHDMLIASNPDYIKAVHAAGVKKGKKSLASKMEGAGPQGASRGSTQAQSNELTQDEKDRIGMLQAYRGKATRRLPGAR